MTLRDRLAKERQAGMLKEQLKKRKGEKRGLLFLPRLSYFFNWLVHLLLAMLYLFARRLDVKRSCAEQNYNIKKEMLKWRKFSNY